ncbi:probable glycosyl transferase [Geomicrobium sp. JCM 19037]|uniref:glycosyltransferase family 2 protein n=1 Tax=Geomicrobium sp. JCM 19037 TaxID=1460634 RepID=UPI00045F16F7|nr:glycosyltransferase family 2 protein [Geomicrobium sp. JCM 19037]GAK03718.1 probable glycosyl transferase [Geomicrobium sp. JCM 19037]
MPPLISVVMPAYNAETYIEQAVESVLAQTYQHLEIIIVNDASTDHTALIVEDMAAQDDRIRICHNEQNRGVSFSRNLAISCATGEWIAFLDSDDAWHHEKIASQMRLVEQKGAEFIFTGATYMDEQSNMYSTVFQVPKEVRYQNLLKQNVISCSSVMIKRKFFEKLQLERDDLSEDYLAWLTILRTGIVAYSVNEPLLIYRISRHSKSGKKVRSIQMTYRVYRHIGIWQPAALFYTMSHLMKSLKKYRKLNIHYF